MPSATPILAGVAPARWRAKSANTGYTMKRPSIRTENTAARDAAARSSCFSISPVSLLRQYRFGHAQRRGRALRLPLVTEHARQHDEKYDADDEGAGDPDDQAAELLVRDGRYRQETPADLIHDVKIVRGEAEHRTHYHHRQHDDAEHENAPTRLQARERPGPRIEDEPPERQIAEHDAPVHRLVEPAAEHHVEMYRGPEPQEQARDVHDRGREGIEQQVCGHAQHALDGAEPATDGCRQPTGERRARSCRHEQRRPHIMEHEMLNPVHEEHVAGVVVPAGLQSGIDEQEPETEDEAPARRRRRIGAGRTSHVKDRYERDADEDRRRELPGEEQE